MKSTTAGGNELARSQQAAQAAKRLLVFAIAVLVPAIAAGQANSRNRTPLQNAAAQNDVERVVELLEQGAGVNDWDYDGWTALHYAVRAARGPAVIEALLEAGADLAIENRDGDTPLEMAAGDDAYRGAHRVIQRWLDAREAERQREAQAERTVEARRQEALARQDAVAERELERLRLQLAIARARAQTAEVPHPADPDSTGIAPPGGSSPGCQLPGYPQVQDIASVGLRWCPVDVNFQIRSFAIQIAGAWCALDSGTSSTTDQIAARHAEINASCEILDAMGGSTCDCDLDPRVRP